MTRAKYTARKVAGKCTRAATCERPPTETSNYCAEHRAEYLVTKARSQARPGPKLAQAIAGRKWLKRRLKDGLCRICPEAAITTWYCEKHRRAKLAAWYAGQGKNVPRSKRRCSTCKEQGHRADTCRRWNEDKLPSIDHYATARNTEAA